MTIIHEDGTMEISKFNRGDIVKYNKMDYVVNDTTYYMGLTGSTGAFCYWLGTLSVHIAPLGRDIPEDELK